MTAALSAEPRHAGWQKHAQRLADTLARRGDLRTPRWRAAVAAVPRHVLVPYAYERDSATGQWSGFGTADLLERVYAPETLVTGLELVEGRQQPVSSCTRPDLLLRMLELLDVGDGDRILEIGTGSGYGAALLAERLGDENVFTVEVDGRLAGLARSHLAASGYHPTVVAADGTGGLPQQAPFDRIIATCPVPRVPWAWAGQLADGGLILADLEFAGRAGNLVLLARDGDRLRGRFATRWAGFPAMRSAAPHPPGHHRAAPAAGAQARETSAPPDPWKDTPLVWFLAHLRLPRDARFGYDLDPVTGRPVATRLSAPDGSWARVDHRGGQVTEAGASPLWAGVEWAFQIWTAAGRPTWNRLGLTVTAGGRHEVWVDDPTGVHRWRFSEPLGKYRA